MFEPFCPNCQPIFSKKNQMLRVGKQLQLVERNYSGCGVDHYECPSCMKLYSVSYKIDRVDEIER
jgi:hypothetical protein